MSTDITRWLQEVSDIKGVEGVYVISNRGQIIAHTSLKIESSRIEAIANRILHIEGAFQKNWSPLKEIELISTEYRVLGMMRENFTILTFCNEEQGLPLIRMTLNVVLAHLLEDKKFMKFISKFPVKKTVLLEKARLDEEETKLISKLQ